MESDRRAETVRLSKSSGQILRDLAMEMARSGRHRRSMEDFLAAGVTSWEPAASRAQPVARSSDYSFSVGESKITLTLARFPFRRHLFRSPHIVWR